MGVGELWCHRAYGRWKNHEGAVKEKTRTLAAYRKILGGDLLVKGKRLWYAYVKNRLERRSSMMLYHEREEIILQQIQLQSTVTISELRELLHVSLDTVRRDLKAMERAGLVKRVRGGACMPEADGVFSNFKGREVIHSDLKREASRKALEYIHPGDVVALNSGTTNAVLAQEMCLHCKDITVVTNNIAAVNILMQASGIRVIAIGGEVDAREQSTFGITCEREFGLYYPDVTFLSINAVNDRDGFTDFRLSEIGIIRFLAEHSRQVIAVMDSSKLGKHSKCKVLDLRAVERLLMDNQVPDGIRAQYREKGILIE